MTERVYSECGRVVRPRGGPCDAIALRRTWRKVAPALKQRARQMPTLFCSAYCQAALHAARRLLVARGRRSDYPSRPRVARARFLRYHCLALCGVLSEHRAARALLSCFTAPDRVIRLFAR